MADEDDYDDGVYFEDDYLYIEDSYALADELAETAVPSPPPVEVVTDDYFASYDPYDYWMDVEYGTDEYYDVLLRSGSSKSTATAGTKRKLAGDGEQQSQGKRRKIGSAKQSEARKESEKIWTGPNVIHMASKELYGLTEPCQACGKPKTYALLPDWKRFVGDDLDISHSHHQGKGSATAASEDDRDASSQSEHLASENPRHDSLMEKSPRSDNQIDSAQLMSILQQSLGSDSNSSGKRGGIQQMLVELLSQSEGQGMEELLENLTKSVLAQVDKGGAGSDMGQWLAQQGVQLQGGAEMDEGDDSLQEDSESEEQTIEDSSEALAQQQDGTPENAASKSRKSKRETAVEKNGIVQQASLPVKAAGTNAKAKGTKRKAEADTELHDSKKHARVTEASPTGKIDGQLLQKRVTRSSARKR
ncbi:hypothetical protein K461DRAFT_264081 [Myriangium duriaei CBS 260.36]|uniref:Uncharacterized protein n=1 Tax=Myriangium duriaei CBS 260.36 TaxID=1168546 RepID=A0A9P4J965_9PEZI|nr:hypothetical protein K461DRAFT_264081 [Myriangium duriaei CBS 260.36]